MEMGKIETSGTTDATDVPGDVIGAAESRVKGSARRASSTSTFGERVDGIEIPVFNERAVRAAAGFLFLFGFTAVMIAALTNNFRPLSAFAMFFMIDMSVRLFGNARLSPTLALGALLVRRQRPEWVGAEQKKLAWGLGLGMAFVSCVITGFFGIEGSVTLGLCGVCLGLLFLESSLGICVGCELHRAFAKQKPELCPGDTCNYTPPGRATNGRREPPGDAADRRV